MDNTTTQSDNILTLGELTTFSRLQAKIVARLKEVRDIIDNASYSEGDLMPNRLHTPLVVGELYEETVSIVGDSVVGQVYYGGEISTEGIPSYLLTLSEESIRFDVQCAIKEALAETTQRRVRDLETRLTHLKAQRAWLEAEEATVRQLLGPQAG